VPCVWSPIRKLWGWLVGSIQTLQYGTRSPSYYQLRTNDKTVSKFINSTADDIHWLRLRQMLASETHFPLSWRWLNEEMSTQIPCPQGSFVIPVRSKIVQQTILFLCFNAGSLIYLPLSHKQRPEWHGPLYRLRLPKPRWMSKLLYRGPPCSVGRSVLGYQLGPIAPEQH
jgi:hypothetical protein